MPRDRNHHHHHSCAQQEAWAAAASSYHYTDHNNESSGSPVMLEHHRSQLMNGETHFPTAMSYLSDAQPSDVATVCSGSVVEDDIEVESILSQEDHHHQQHHTHHHHSTAAASAAHQHHGSPTNTEYPNVSSSHFSFASKRPLRQNELPTIPRKSTTDGFGGVGSALHPSVTPPNEEQTGTPSVPQEMGPPLNRAFLLSKTGAVPDENGGIATTAGGGDDDDGGGDEKVDENHFSKPEALAASQEQDCGCSVDVEAHSVYSQDEIQSTDHSHSSNHNNNNNNNNNPAERTRQLLALKVSFSRPCSVKSFGSQAGSESGGGGNGQLLLDTDDCGGSLDVETHSIGTRSIHSQEDNSAVAASNSPEQQSRQQHHPRTPASRSSSIEDNAVVSTAAATAAATTDSDNTLLPESTTESSTTSRGGGRRSPGGTIYKGRGERRYRGRHMNLTLKRFHNDGVHPEAVQNNNEVVVTTTTCGGGGNGGGGAPNDESSMEACKNSEDGCGCVGRAAPNGFNKASGQGQVYDGRRNRENKHKGRDAYREAPHPNGERGRSRNRSRSRSPQTTPRT